ncbi:MAG: PD-(D/E)XK nuclease family protein [Candidatus Micrarchaeota archaeon]|nr:PD-(D/E)XK nuclease family protein [Candidatus Micrarchaeota archaeon]
MPFELSPSSINLFLECPRCFWLEKHKVWKRPSAGFPTLPSGMDRILKEHFDRFRDRGELPPELRNSECRQGYSLFQDTSLLREWRNARKGISWKDEEGNVLRGGIDNLLVKGNKLVVLDYKTRGFPAKEETYKAYQHQLDIYTFLLRKNGYSTENFAFIIFYVPKKVTETGEVIFDSELVKMSVNVENAERIFREAISLLKGPCPKEKCEWCERV